MSAAETLDLPLMSFAGFVEFERTSDVKHEIWDGLLVAMAGGTERHVIVSKNLLVEIDRAIEGRDEREVFGSDKMVYQPEADKGVYPDVSAVCGPREYQEDRQGENRVLLDPQLVVEVLPRSTAQRDIGLKFDRYQSIPSLSDYVLIDPTVCWIRCFRRTEAGWLMERIVDPAGVLDLASLRIGIPVERIYRGVKLSETSDVLAYRIDA